MTEPSDFGRFLKERRMAAHLTQDELAAAINKSGQYISNIEKGKNKAKASADRGRLPNAQMEYLMKHRKLLELINYGLENNINDRRWAELLSAVSGGKPNDLA